MGTSKPADGPNNNNPLIPTWLDDGGDSPFPPENPRDNAPDGDQQQPQPLPQRPQIPLPPSTDRFGTPRRNFTDYLKYGDKRHLGRALRGYVKSGSGGASNALTRMGSAPATAARTANFLRSAYTRGVTEALRELDLSHLEGQSTDVILGQVIDKLCPTGGTEEEAISRDALAEAFIGLEDLNNLNILQIRLIIANIITRSVYDRILIDIGQKAITLPATPGMVEVVEKETTEFIKNSVEWALEGKDIMRNDDIESLIKSVYMDAFTLMETYNE